MVKFYLRAPQQHEEPVANRKGARQSVLAGVIGNFRRLLRLICHLFLRLSVATPSKAEELCCHNQHDSHANDVGEEIQCGHGNGLDARNAPEQCDDHAKQQVNGHGSREALQVDLFQQLKDNLPHDKEDALAHDEGSTFAGLGGVGGHFLLLLAGVEDGFEGVEHIHGIYLP